MKITSVRGVDLGSGHNFGMDCGARRFWWLRREGRQACQFSDHDCWVIQLLAATRCNPCFNYEIKDSRESFTKASSANWKEADIEY
ncbi:hypothetical protein EPI10_020103 [Gossypium australe]|uniref:Uncharacterized protein n=1 Tax=Gossypium australe TaxID=47621 RepID=A0A5B6WEM3_9ROSI|nr:hypothetical protein EPI10_020103 [Gossypium australe]